MLFCVIGNTDSGSSKRPAEPVTHLSSRHEASAADVPRITVNATPPENVRPTCGFSSEAKTRAPDERPADIDCPSVDPSWLKFSHCGHNVEGASGSRTSCGLPGPKDGLGVPGLNRQMRSRSTGDLLVEAYAGDRDTMYEIRADGALYCFSEDVQDDFDVVDDVNIQKTVLLGNRRCGESSDDDNVYDNVYFPNRQQRDDCWAVSDSLFGSHVSGDVPAFPQIEDLHADKASCGPDGGLIKVRGDDDVGGGGALTSRVRCPVTVTVTGELCAAGVDGLHMPSLDSLNDSGLDCHHCADG